MKFKPLLRDIGASLLVIGALSVSAFANADDVYSQPMYNLQQAQPYQTYNDQSCCQQICSPAYTLSCNTYPCCEPPVCGWAYNPPAYCKCDDPCDNSCNKYVFTADLLWWKASVGGIALGSLETLILSSSGNEQISDNSHVKNPSFKFQPGFRLGIANQSICDCWDMGLDWTHYHTTAHAHAQAENISNFSSSGANLVFISYWERFGEVFSLFPEESKSRYSLNLDFLDLDFGRKFYVSCCFILRPHFGLRGARINQDYKVLSQALGFNDKSLSDATFFTSKVKSSNDFLGLGPRIGLEAEVKLGCGLSLLGKAAGSLIYGRFKRHSTEACNLSREGSTELLSYTTQTPTLCCARAFTDFSIGAKWERCIEWCNRVHPVGIEFAWEQHGLFSMSNFDFEDGFQTLEFITSTAHSKNGDIFTQGLTASLSLGF